MKSHARVIIALFLITFLTTIPSSLVSQQLPVPVERSVFPGVTTIQYAGQTLVFTTSVPLRVKLRADAVDKIVLRFRSQTTGDDTSSPLSLFGSQTVIFWEQAADELYNGQAPPDWVDIPLNEGGWTEK